MLAITFRLTQRHGTRNNGCFFCSLVLFVSESTNARYLIHWINAKNSWNHFLTNPNDLNRTLNLVVHMRGF